MRDRVTRASTPHATAGYHFASLLQCLQRARYDYFGDREQQSSPPMYLKALQREGIEHETAVYRAYYPGALRVQEDLPPPVRLEQTLNGLRRHEPVILQAYLRDGNDVGVADVVEREAESLGAGSDTPYRVGECKRATSLTTAHVLQAAWYTELLREMIGRAGSTSLFYLGDDRLRTVNLTDVNRVFEQCKDELRALQDSRESPGPHLCRWCASCPWRGFCIPELIRTQHLSLLPGISREHVRRLRESGIERWYQLAGVSDALLSGEGLDARAMAGVRSAVNALPAGTAVLRYGLNQSLLTGLVVVSVEYESGGSEADGRRLAAVWYETKNGPKQLPFDYDVSGKVCADLSGIDIRNGLAVYGSSENAILAAIVLRAGTRKFVCYDVVSLLESAVHAPLLGLELETLLEYIDGAVAGHPTGAHRVPAIRRVLDWIAEGEAAQP